MKRFIINKRWNNVTNIISKTFFYFNKNFVDDKDFENLIEINNHVLYKTQFYDVSDIIIIDFNLFVLIKKKLLKFIFELKIKKVIIIVS